MFTLQVFFLKIELSLLFITAQIDHESSLPLLIEHKFLILPITNRLTFLVLIKLPSTPFKRDFSVFFRLKIMTGCSEKFIVS